MTSFAFAQFILICVCYVCLFYAASSVFYDICQRLSVHRSANIWKQIAPAFTFCMSVL